MRILQLISGIDLSGGGPSKSVSDLAMNLEKQGLDVTIFTNSSANPYLKESQHSNLQLQFIKGVGFKKALKDFLMTNQFDLLHGHGIWQMPVHYMAQLARKNCIPYIITPRGMLEPWALNVGKWKKKLAIELYQRNDLARASCIHATAPMEAENILKLGFRNPIDVIPNGIDLSEFPCHKCKTQNDKQTLLFLSRIHPKKGIEILINAWQKLSKTLRQHWRVEIAGNGEESYIATLNKLVHEKGLADEIFLIGPQFGKAKIATYHRANLFVLPTYSENFGIVVVEAMACGVPVITTNGTPWEEVNTCSAGWWIDIGVEPLVETLKQAMQLSEVELHQMGQNGRKLVEENYNIVSVAQKMIELYERILDGGNTRNSYTYN